MRRSVFFHYRWSFSEFAGWKENPHIFLLSCTFRKWYSPGVGNSFCLTGHIGNTIVLRGPVSVTWGLKLSIKSGENEFFSFYFVKKLKFYLICQIKYLSREPEKCSRATLRCLAGRMWPAVRTLPRPGITEALFNFFFLQLSSTLLIVTTREICANTNTYFKAFSKQATIGKN